MALQEKHNHAVAEVDSRLLPPTRWEHLSRYHRFLVNRLSFPFRAVYHEPVGLTEDATYEVTVVRLCDPAKHHSEQGLLCRAVRRGKLVELPLVEIEVTPDSPNFPLIEEYWSWAWNDLQAAALAY